MDPENDKDLGKTRLLELGVNKSALLVGVYTSSKDRQESLEHLDELESLATTYGLDTVEKIASPLRKIESSTYLGSGKVQELADMAEEMNVSIIIFDFSVAPHQQRNLEKILKKTVIDRTELILGVFAIHAKTKEAKLQIKLAQCPVRGIYRF